MTAKELMKQCEAEEKELKFREFSSVQNLKAVTYDGQPILK